MIARKTVRVALRYASNKSNAPFDIAAMTKLVEHDNFELRGNDC